MIFPFLLLIADLFLWAIFADATAMGDPLVNIALFGLALGVFFWTIWETFELGAKGGGGDE